MKIIATIINKNQKKNINDLTYYLVFSPRRSYLCKEALVNLGVYGDLCIQDFSFDLIPLESDILSLEMDFYFKEYFLGNDLSLA